MGPILAIDPLTREALSRWQSDNASVNFYWLIFLPLRELNGINPNAKKWKGWRSTIWGGAGGRDSKTYTPPVLDWIRSVHKSFGTKPARLSRAGQLMRYDRATLTINGKSFEIQNVEICTSSHDPDRA